MAKKKTCKSQNENNSLLFGINGPYPSALAGFLQSHVTAQEAQCISTQISSTCNPGYQVLWTGMPKEAAQKWADNHGLQTLTAALGPFMNNESNICPKRSKSDKQWTEYVHAASAIFSWYISKCDRVIVLCTEPPVRFHPSGCTSFQCIELPIITGELGNRPVGRIDMVHPFTANTVDFSYQFWPEDQVELWLNRFGATKRTLKWRNTKERKPSCTLTCGRKNNMQCLRSLASKPPTFYSSKSVVSTQLRPIQARFTAQQASTYSSTLDKQHKCEVAQLNKETDCLRRKLREEKTGAQEVLKRRRIKTTAFLKGKQRKAANRKFDEQGRQLTHIYIKKRADLDKERDTDLVQLRKRQLRERKAEDTKKKTYDLQQKQLQQKQLQQKQPQQKQPPSKQLKEKPLDRRETVEGQEAKKRPAAERTLVEKKDIEIQVPITEIHIVSIQTVGVQASLQKQEQSHEALRNDPNGSTNQSRSWNVRIHRSFTRMYKFSQSPLKFFRALFRKESISS